MIKDYFEKIIVVIFGILFFLFFVFNGFMDAILSPRDYNLYWAILGGIGFALWVLYKVGVWIYEFLTD